VVLALNWRMPYERLGFSVAMVVEQSIGEVMGHHYVPQKYLRGFSDSKVSGMIWQHDKQTEKAIKVPIKVIAQQRDYYSQEMERDLNDLVEIPGNAAIENLCNGISLSPADRSNLSIYIATMMKRVPRHRIRAREGMPEVLDDVLSAIRVELQTSVGDANVDASLIKARLAELDEIEAKYRAEIPAEVIKETMNQFRNPTPTEEHVSLIHKMTWRVLTSTGPSYFLTCDNPATHFEAWGLGRRESEFAFPLCTTRLLHGCWQPLRAKRACVHISQKRVKSLNRRIACAATRFVYYHRDEKWLRAISRKKIEQCDRFKW